MNDIAVSFKAKKSKFLPPPLVKLHQDSSKLRPLELLVLKGCSETKTQDPNSGSAPCPTLQQEGANARLPTDCTSNHPKISAVITETELFPALHPKFLWYLSCVAKEFPFSKQKHLSSSLLSRPYLKGAVVPQECRGKYEITMKVIIWKLHMWWAETLLWEICCFCSATTLAELFFFPRNQVPHCCVTKVNNDSLNDPKKKNWSLAPLKGIWTGKFDNVTNHSNKHYLKIFSLRWASQQHAETTALHGCAVTFTAKLCFSILRQRSVQKKLYVKKAVWRIRYKHCHSWSSQC